MCSTNLVYHRAKLRTWGFHPLTVCWASGEAVVNAFILVQTTTFYLCSHHGSSICQVPPVFQDMWDKSHSLRCHPKKLGHWICSPTLSLLRKKLGVEDFLLILWYFLRYEGCGQKVFSIFLLVFTWLVLHSIGVQEPHVLFQDFSQRELIQVLLLKSVGERRVQGCFFHHLADVIPQIIEF